MPDLPGCITTGPTREETERLIREAIEFHLAGMREDGEPIPEPTTVAVMLLVESIARSYSSFTTIRLPSISMTCTRLPGMT